MYVCFHILHINTHLHLYGYICRERRLYMYMPDLVANIDITTNVF